MSPFDPTTKLAQLLNLPAENEIVEFKEAKSDFDSRKLGRYFSALSNEANLNSQSAAWLVLGVNDQRQVVGTSFRGGSRANLDSLKLEVATKTTGRVTFIEIHEIAHSQGRVLLFEIPPAPCGIPVAFEGHEYGRDGQSLGALNTHEYDRIRAQSTVADWSAGVIHDATIDDLDPDAIIQARLNFISKFPEKTEEADAWDDAKFLDKAKLTIKGQITRTGLLLLGREESEHFLQPADPKIRWVLRDEEGNSRDYEIICIPFLKAVDKVFAKIRKLKYRYMRDGTLFPEEIEQYDPYSFREAVNNCIAHQDYSLAGRINVIERDESLRFTNLGSFVAGSIERVVVDDRPPEYYRNRFLATAMFNLKMVDTEGGGIRKMFLTQRKRFFPMPDYDLENGRVEVTLIGKVLDLDYARMLATNSDLSLAEILLLDRVQKRLPLEDHEAKSLKERKLIEGRKPNYFIAKAVAQTTGQKAVYTKNRAFDKQYYLDLILRAIGDHGSMTRKDFDELLWNKLPDWMDDEQRSNKIGNLISELRRAEKIRNAGTLKYPKWVAFG